MRVLLVEDHDQLAGPVARELERKFGYSVTHARDPIDAARTLVERPIDVAVVDLLFEQRNHDFEARRAAGGVNLTDGQLLISGLFVLHRLLLGKTKAMVWTSGEANRRLHLLFAYEELGVTDYCSKSSGGGGVDVLHEAIQATAAHRQYVDPVLNAYLPERGSVTLAMTLLRDRAKRSIWRAAALGARTRRMISDVTGYSERHIGNVVPRMADDLAAFDPGLEPAGAPLSDVVGYASRNWEFFLDHAVRELYP